MAHLIMLVSEALLCVCAVTKLGKKSGGYVLHHTAFTFTDGFKDFMLYCMLVM